MTSHADLPADLFIHLPHSKSSSDRRKLATAVYAQVWTEFYSWEPSCCSQLIALLSHDGDPRRLPVNSSLVEEIFLPGQVSEVHDMDIDQNPGVLSTVWDRHGLSARVEFYCEDVIAEKFFPYPSYESTTPISKNMMYPEDAYQDMMFIPYADDDRFDAKKFAYGLSCFSWQDDHIDPDLEVIQLETARRLHYSHGFSFTEIDNLGFLRKLSISNESGLIWDTSQRDILHWPGDLSGFDNFSISFSLCNADDLHTRLGYTISTFCPSLNCVQPMCQMHCNKFYPGFDTTKPQITNLNMVLAEGKVCGEYCFRQPHHESFADTVYWENEEDTKMLSTVLKLMPDLFPCDLAIICRKPCCEVFVQRTRLIQDKSIIDHINDFSTHQRLPSFQDISHNNFTPVHPCHHKGPCNIQVNCKCYRSGQHCQRSCRCNFDCKLHWKGCDCQISSKACTKMCKCLLAGRECDPELCQSCGARDALHKPHSRGCRNVKIQRGDSEPLEIKTSTFGLGAFATYSIKQGSLVGEYVGDLVTEETVKDSSIREFNGLNYLFNLNKEVHIEAADAGNETRFINHATAPANNCEAGVRLVNGDHRLGLFATRKIKAGEELFLDYGEAYWEGHPLVTRDDDSDAVANT